jgi:phosphoribosylamine-glycine ligase
VRLIEYNARFGDPEAMNVLSILDADLVELCAAAAAGRLGEVSWAFRPEATVCKYVVPEDYPGRSARTKVGAAPEGVAGEEAAWFWAACEREGDDVFMTSSRTGAFVGTGTSLGEAEAKAEAAASALQREWPVRHRPDIGTDALVQRRIDHMRSLRG